jgi:hypothetical protein
MAKIRAVSVATARLVARAIPQPVAPTASTPAITAAAVMAYVERPPIHSTSAFNQHRPGGLLSQQSR